MDYPNLSRTNWNDPVASTNYDDHGMLVEQGKRRTVTEVIARMALPSGPPGDVYNFGVYTGGGLKALVDGFRTNNVRIGHIWGFDSFRGLPDSDLRRHSTSGQAASWKAGKLNAAEQLSKVMGSKAFRFPELRKHIISGIGTPNATLVPGFFNESLPALAPRLRNRMRPALLVDIDCDIYEGTLEGLEFLFKGGLLLPGYSTVYYDDWQSEAHGEAKAHHQLARKHGAVWRNLQLSDACRASGRSCGRQRLFQLVSINRPA
jgi:hypothetical protein